MNSTNSSWTIMAFKDHGCLRGPCRGKEKEVGWMSLVRTRKPTSQPHNEEVAPYFQTLVARWKCRPRVSRGSSSFQKEAINPDFYVKYTDFEILATYSNILKTVWSKWNSFAGCIQPIGCQIETSVLDNVLMDEDNSFMVCDHSSWEFPTRMNWILHFFPHN